MEHKIIRLEPSDYEKCGNIWDMQRQSDLAAQQYQRLLSGNQTTFVYTIDNAFIGEVSLVRQMDDPDYTIPDRRVYLSRLLVKESHRRQGIGRRLVAYAAETAKQQGFCELSVGVDLDNYAAVRLYVQAGFDRILFAGEDAYGRYLKLLKAL